MKSISEIFSIFPLANYISWTLYITLYYIVCFIILLTILMIVYDYYFDSRFVSSITFVANILNISINLMITILYIPMMGFLISIFYCHENESKIVHTFDSNITCFTGSHILHVIFGVVFGLIFLIIVCFFSFHLYDVKFQKSPNLKN